MSPPVRLAAAFDHAGEVPLDFFFGLALALLFLVEVVEGIADAGRAFVLVNELRGWSLSS